MADFQHCRGNASIAAAVLRRNATGRSALVGTEVAAMGRVFLVTGLWFVFWMSVGIFFAVMAKGLDGLSTGFMNGAWIATLTSFAWPWIMPESISRWMDG
jgi:hypothetical protein